MGYESAYLTMQVVKRIKLVKVSKAEVEVLEISKGVFRADSKNGVLAERKGAAVQCCSNSGVSIGSKK